MYAEALLFTFGTQYLLKSAIIRYRPYMYEDGIPDGKGNDYYNSFPSGATSLAFFGATFLSTTFSDEFPESKWKLSIITGSYTLAIGVASLRILSGCHFLTDVFMGAAIGSLYGWLIPWLHLRNDNEKISIVPTGNGLIVSLKF
jgi:membrane-associated phospholipid phosphatase